MFVVKLNASLVRTFRIMPVLDAFAEGMSDFVVHTPHTDLFYGRPYRASAKTAQVDWTLPAPESWVPDSQWLDRAYREFEGRMGTSPSLAGPVARLNADWDKSQTLYMDGKWLNPDIVVVYQREASGPALPPGLMARAMSPLGRNRTVFNVVSGVDMSKLANAVNLLRPDPDPDIDPDGEALLINGLNHRTEPPDLLQVMRIISAAKVLVTNTAWARDIAAGYRVPSVVAKSLYHNWKYPYGHSFPGDFLSSPPDMPESHVYAGYDCPDPGCRKGKCPYSPLYRCALKFDPDGLTRMVEDLLN